MNKVRNKKIQVVKGHNNGFFFNNQPFALLNLALNCGTNYSVSKSRHENKRNYHILLKQAECCTTIAVTQAPLHDDKSY
jgi:hypothetical protein